LELRELLLPFRNLTKLVSNGQPTLGLIPLIIKEVREIIKHKADNSDSDVIKDLKYKLALTVDRRLASTDASNVAAVLDPAMKDFVIAEKGEDCVKQSLKVKNNDGIANKKTVRSWLMS
jgi:hypothetical protein